MPAPRAPRHRRHGASLDRSRPYPHGDEDGGGKAARAAACKEPLGGVPARGVVVASDEHPLDACRCGEGAEPGGGERRGGAKRGLRGDERERALDALGDGEGRPVHRPEPDRRPEDASHRLPRIGHRRLGGPCGVEVGALEPGEGAVGAGRAGEERGIGREGAVGVAVEERGVKAEGGLAPDHNPARAEIGIARRPLDGPAEPPQPPGGLGTVAEALAGARGGGAARRSEPEEAPRLARVHLRRERRGVGQHKRHLALPLGLQRRHVHDDPAARVGRLPDAERQDVARDLQPLDRARERERLRRDVAVVALHLDDVALVERFRVDLARPDVGEDLEPPPAPHVVPVARRSALDPPRGSCVASATRRSRRVATLERSSLDPTSSPIRSPRSPRIGITASLKSCIRTTGLHPASRSTSTPDRSSLAAPIAAVCAVSTPHDPTSTPSIATLQVPSDPVLTDCDSASLTNASSSGSSAPSSVGSDTPFSAQNRLQRSPRSA